MVHLSTLAGLLAASSCAYAFPQMNRDFLLKAREASNGKVKRQGFSPSQLIDVTGSHAFSPPGSGDQRGPCPGLNALANHNYLPHNGVGTIQQFIDSTNEVFGMGLDLATFLATYGAVMDGNLLSWSIGGPPGGALAGGLLSQPQGISYSHNKYESDVSPTRGDLYEYGNDYLVQLPQFKQLYGMQSGDNANYNLDVLTQFRADRFQQSIENNPYFFNGPFTGIAVQPAAYTFIYRFMSNKSAEAPEGILNQDVLKSFFAISGDDDDLVYTPGYERIPDNWYTRASDDPYTIPYFMTDLLAAAETHPEFLSVGGNFGKTNSFTGVDPEDLTGGVYNLKTLTEGNNALCFAVEAALQMAPDFLKGIVSDLTSAVNEIQSTLTGDVGNCPAITSFNETALAQFPGFTKSLPS